MPSLRRLVSLMLEGAGLDVRCELALALSEDATLGDMPKCGCPCPPPVLLPPLPFAGACDTPPRRCGECCEGIEAPRVEGDTDPLSTGGGAGPDDAKRLSYRF